MAKTLESVFRVFNDVLDTPVNQLFRGLFGWCRRHPLGWTLGILGTTWWIMGIALRDLWLVGAGVLFLAPAIGFSLPNKRKKPELPRQLTPEEYKAQLYDPERFDYGVSGLEWGKPKPQPECAPFVPQADRVEAYQRVQSHRSKFGARPLPRVISREEQHASDERLYGGRRRQLTPSPSHRLLADELDELLAQLQYDHHDD